MKKEYISPEFNAVRFNSEDIIRTSAGQTSLETLNGVEGLKVAQIEDRTINVFNDTVVE